MEKRHRKLGQYIYENHNYEGTVEEFLEETAPLIGYIIHRFNLLDAQLNSSICELISDRADQKGAIVIYKMNFSSKVDLLYRLIRSMEIDCQGELPTFNLFIENLKKCATLRNAVVHAEWENLDQDGYTYVKMSFDKNGMQQHYWQFTSESLKEIEEFIHKTYMDFDVYENEKQELLRQ